MDRKHNISLNIRYGLLQCLFWITYCVLVTNHNSYLLEHGYSSSEIGIMMVCGYLACIILHPVLASLADRSRYISTTHILLFSYALLLASSITLLFQNSRNFFITASYIVLYTVSMWCQPLMNAYANTLSRTGAKVSFAIWRGVGAGAYAICSVLFGFVLRAHTSAIMPKIGIFCILALISVTLLFLREGLLKAPIPTDGTSEKKRFSPKSYPGFIILLIGTAAVSAGHMIFNNYLLQTITFLGGDEAKLGILSFYAAILELPAVFIFHFLQKKFPNAFILKFSAICFFTKNLLYAVAPSANFLFLPQSLQLLSFGLFNPASVEFINETMAPEHLNQGHALSTIISTIFLLLITGMSGIIIDHFSIRIALFIGAGISLVGLFFMFYGIAGTQRLKKNLHGN